MLWVAAPPSDHDAKLYEVPPSVCGDDALIELIEFTITVRANGVTELVLPTVSDRPDGTEAKLRPTVFGSRRTLVVALAPAESVAVNCSSSQAGYSWSGPFTLPAATPLNVWIG